MLSLCLALHEPEPLSHFEPIARAYLNQVVTNRISQFFAANLTAARHNNLKQVQPNNLTRAQRQNLRRGLILL